MFKVLDVTCLCVYIYCREREREKRDLLSRLFMIIGWFLHVVWLGIEPQLVYLGDALTSWAPGWAPLSALFRPQKPTVMRLPLRHREACVNHFGWFGFIALAKGEIDFERLSDLPKALRLLTGRMGMRSWVSPLSPVIFFLVPSF